MNNNNNNNNAAHANSFKRHRHQLGIDNTQVKCDMQFNTCSKQHQSSQPLFFLLATNSVLFVWLTVFVFSFVSLFGVVVSLPYMSCFVPSFLVLTHTLLFWFEFARFSFVVSYGYILLSLLVLSSSSFCYQTKTEALNSLSFVCFPTIPYIKKKRCCTMFAENKNKPKMQQHVRFLFLFCFVSFDCWSWKAKSTCRLIF